MDKPFRKSSASAGSFLPAEYVRGKRDHRTNVLGLLLFGVVMLGVCGAFVVTNRQWKSVRDEQRRIGQLYEEETQKIEQLKTLEAQRKELVDRAEVTTALVETTPRSVLLGELTIRLPEGASIKEVNLESKRVRVAAASTKGKSVKSLRGRKKSDKKKDEKPKIVAPRFEQELSIVGVAEANEQIADYLTALKDCELFSSVELEFIKDTRINQVTLRSFEMKAELKRDADVTLLAAAEPAALMQAAAAPIIAGEAPIDRSPIENDLEEPGSDDTDQDAVAETDVATVDTEGN